MVAKGLELSKYPILVVDDEPDNLDAIRFNFGKSFTLLPATSGEEALALAKANDVAVIVTDQRMPRMTGLDLLRAARDVRPDAVGIIVTAFTDVDVLIEAINLGRIYRYVTKPWDAKELRGVLTHAVERFALLRENRRLTEQAQQYAGILSSDAHGDFNFGAIVGDSPPLRDVLTRVEQVAQTSSTVLLRGETGTGKEMVARAIHINSTRESRPFVRVNCAALAPGVLESELFGHEKGAFTGAVARRLGRFELADGGTLFLDEVGDLPVDVQVKLLRVLQEREFERVGGTETVKVDVRVISATHRDLETLIASNEFREDLYYRLNVFPITLPPLRERPGDIALLCEHFIQKYAQSIGKRVRGLDPGAVASLTAYSWPGNVRELENVIERAMILARGSELTAADLEFSRRPLSAAAIAPTSLSTGGGGFRTTTPVRDGGRPLHERLSEQERGEIITAIEQAQGNIALAARTLGINRSTLYYRLRKHGLEHLLPLKEPPAATGGEPGTGVPPAVQPQ
ncbi:MAG TPA: sigma-54 dependent transcriptional regulator [Polyangia bacterium]|jgi:DNA-binding NtrC family response regulator|nr:sigma-54 dependent transcriptional regulator [Polyangia bacterium]